MTAPTVAPQTTVPMAEARRFGANRSAATYRDSWLDELPKPISTVPASRIGREATTTANVAMSAPTTPIR